MGEAQEAEFVVRLALQGMTTFVRLTGQGAEHMAAALKALQNKKEYTPGEKRMMDLLKQGKSMDVFKVPVERMGEFVEQAKRYGLQYYLIERDGMDHDTGIQEIYVKLEDAPILNEIARHMHLGSVEGKMETGNITEAEKQSAVDLTRAQEIIRDMTSPNREERENARPEPSEPTEHSQSAGSYTSTENESKEEKQSIREQLKTGQDELDSSRDMFREARSLRESMMSGAPGAGRESSFPGWEKPTVEYDTATGERLYRGKTAGQMTDIDRVQFSVDNEMERAGKLSEDFIESLYMGGFQVNKNGIVEPLALDISDREKRLIADMMRNPGEAVRDFKQIKEAYMHGQ